MIEGPGGRRSAEPELPGAGGCAQLPVVDAEPFLRVRQLDCECRSFGVFEFDLDGVAVGQVDVGDDGGRARVVAALGKGGGAFRSLNFQLFIATHPELKHVRTRESARRDRTGHARHEGHRPATSPNG